LSFNPIEHAVPPRGQSKRPKQWTAKQSARFLDVGQNNRFYALGALAATTGMLCSELAHLDREGLNLAVFLRGQVGCSRRWRSSSARSAAVLAAGTLRAARPLSLWSYRPAVALKVDR
jgi:hypothetical protein